MRVGVALLLLSAACDCDEGPGRDAAPESGPDATADASRDGSSDASDSASDADGSSGNCPEGEEPVEAFAIPHDEPEADCGAGCRQITWSMGAGIRTYDVQGTKLAYHGSGVPVGVVDLDTGEEIGFPVADPEEAFTDYGPIAVWESTVVYSSYLPERRPAYLWRLDLETRCRKLLRELEAQDDRYVDVPRGVDLDAGLVVWADERWGRGRQDVFSYDLDTGIERQVTFDRCCTAAGQVSGTQLVYVGWADGPYGIFLFDFEQGSSNRLLPGDAHEQGQPAIDGSMVVFTYTESFAPWNDDIHAIDLATGEHFMVADEGSIQNWADLHGRIAVWEDYRNDPAPNGEDPVQNIDIYARELPSGQEVQITSLPGLEGRPRVWRRTVFFQALIGEAAPQVFAIDLPGARPRP
jgi:hypothetical protein